MTWREISAEAYNNLKSALVIDVRSPGEHELERIPSSVNVPLLSNDERAEIGTIYKERGEIVARRRALKLISPKISDFVEHVLSLRQHSQTVVIYCWRGGLRSEAVASVLSIGGLDCYRLTGGYKAWRSQVLADLDSDKYPFNSVVLHGLTGCGKTEILTHMAAAGHQVLNLEQLANHRGSVFGGLGLVQQPGQKNFEAALWQDIRRFSADEIVLLEGEGRKVGKLSVPDCIFKRISTGIPVLITGSLRCRAERITADYLRGTEDRDSESHEVVKALTILDQLKGRLGNKEIAHIKHLATSGKIIDAVEMLLRDYYDPLYAKQIDRAGPFKFSVSSDNINQAIDQLSEWLSADSKISSAV